ncbi:helix-turn-helix transcriptional regulator [Luteolibacter arcticus]|uniref:Helix-turn-helix transcriptional regulator n=1 Tax=Luteolibacter arcticus TaxID=1581411 RepID=A0ABT3GM05_9BACT|nr:helix-turn-helix transcriptional regulator [Luteolibacter arcticus]MCW1924500.1 helix-turn-helix transcriptional regulator [Luteolibacter arcticus]
MEEFQRLLDRKLAAGNHRRQQRVMAWAGLLDAAGWYVAIARGDGSLWLGEHAKGFLERLGEVPDQWPALVELLGRVPGTRVDLSGESVCLWSDREAATSMGTLAVPLTKRESEVWEWIRRGKTTPEIAVILGCAPRTVETHVGNLYRKIGVRDRGSAILGKPFAKE